MTATIHTQPVPNGLAYPPPLQSQVVAFPNDGAITLVAGGIAILTNTDAGAYTLAAPSANHNGVLLFITSTAATAQVITNASVGFNGKGSSGTITFGGATGDGCILVAYNGAWYTVAEHNVTVA